MGAYDIALPYGLSADQRTAKWYADTLKPAEPDSVPRYAAATENDNLSSNMRRAAATNHEEASLAAKAGIDTAQLLKLRLLTSGVLKKLDKAVLADRKDRTVVGTTPNNGGKHEGRIVEIAFSSQGSEVEDEAIIALLPTLLVNAQLLPRTDSAERVGMYEVERFQLVSPGHEESQTTTASPNTSVSDTKDQPGGNEGGSEQSTMGKLAKRIGLHRKSFSNSDGRGGTSSSSESIWKLRYNDH